MNNLDSILKSRDFTFPTNVGRVKTMVCLVVMYGFESGIIKKAELRRIDDFELWCWRRILRAPLGRQGDQTSQSVKQIRPEYILEGLMLKLMRSADSLEKTLMLGKIKSRRRSGRQRMMVG